MTARSTSRTAPTETSPKAEPPVQRTPARRLPAPSGSRRRGSALLEAIRAAVLALVADQGVGGVTMEAVAARAATSKPVLYRRWPDRTALLRDVLLATAVEDVRDVDTGGLRGDLQASLQGWAALLSGRLGGVIGSAIVGAVPHDPELADAFRRKVIDWRRDQLAEIVDRGVRRGEVRADLPLDVVLELGPAMLWHRLLVTGEPITEAFVTRLVDDVLIPLVAR